MRTYVAAGLVAMGLAVGSADAAFIDFETPSQFANHFRLLEDEGTTGAGAAAVVQSSNGLANDYARLTGGSGGSRYTTVYDTTPVNATVRDTFAPGVTVELDARMSTANQSVGIYLINGSAAAENNAYLALFNVDNTGTNDLIRFSSSTDPSSSANNAIGLAGDPAASAGYNASATDFVHLKLVYTLDALNHPVLTFTAGSLTKTTTFTSVTGFSTVGIGFRLSTAGQNVLDIDNVKITPVPEPAAMALSAFAAMGLLMRRRSRRA